MLGRLRQRQEWKFFGCLPKADRPLAAAWWIVLILRGLLPAAFAIATGALIGAIRAGHGIATALALTGVAFVLLQVLAPLHQAISANLGSRLAAWLYDRLTEAYARPPGMGHLEDPKLTSDVTVAREFDLEMTGPPMHINMDFIAGSLVEMVGGLAAAVVLFAFAWWAPIVLAGAWLATHWLLRESSVWRDRNTEEVRAAQRLAEYAYRLAVDPPAAKELRLFGLAGWTIARFIDLRTLLFDLQYRATRLRERPVIWSLLLVAAANVAVFGTLAGAAVNGLIGLESIVVFAQAALATSMIAFGGLNWALDGAAAPVAAVLRLEPSMGPAGALTTPQRPLRPPADMPAGEIRFRDVTFAYPRSERRVLDGFDLTLPAGSSLAIVGQNGAGKTTLAKLLCRLYDPQGGAIEVDGTDLRALDVDAWRSRLTAVFQDFIRFELPLRNNVAPAGAPDDMVLATLAEAGAGGLAGLDTPLARISPGPTQDRHLRRFRVPLLRCGLRRPQADRRGDARQDGGLLQELPGQVAPPGGPCRCCGRRRGSPGEVLGDERPPLRQPQRPLGGRDPEARLQAPPRSGPLPGGSRRPWIGSAPRRWRAFPQG